MSECVAPIPSSSLISQGADGFDTARKSNRLSPVIPRADRFGQLLVRGVRDGEAPIYDMPNVCSPTTVPLCRHLALG
jgi:hypothetical protein